MSRFTGLAGRAIALWMCALVPLCCCDVRALLPGAGTLHATVRAAEHRSGSTHDRACDSGHPDDPHDGCEGHDDESCACGHLRGDGLQDSIAPGPWPARVPLLHVAVECGTRVGSPRACARASAPHPRLLPPESLLARASSLRI